MKTVTSLGKYLFALPFLVFGIFHFMRAGEMAAMTPGGSEILVYVTGVAHILAAISILIGKLDKLAAILLAVMLLLFIILVHVPAMENNPNEMSAILKNVVMIGGALMYAHTLAQDNSVVG